MTVPTPEHNHQDGLFTSEDLLNAFDSVLHPRPTTGQAAFRMISAIGVAIGLLVLLGLSSPFLPDDVICAVAAWLPFRSKEVVDHVCDWLGIVSQVAIVLFIGGVAFTESFARKVAGMAAKLQQAAIEAQVQANDKRRAELEDAYRRFRALGDAKTSYKEKVRGALNVFWTVYKDTAHLQERYVWFAAKGLVFNFPGGLYGFLGFIFLLIQVMAISTKILVDYLPASCPMR